MKLKKGDNVLVITGKDRGRTGKIVRTFPEAEKIIVENVNMRKKRRKPRRQGQKGEMIEIGLAMDVSNVKLVCPKCTKAVRVRHKLTGENKYRACKKCGENL